MPWICAARAAGRTAPRELAGSTATIRGAGLRALSTSPTPVIVPPVPTPATKHVDAAVERLEDLRPGRAAVDLGVRRVGELVGQEHVGARAPCARAASTASSMPPIDSVISHPRAVEAQQRLALAAHALRQVSTRS